MCIYWLGWSCPIRRPEPCTERPDPRRSRLSWRSTPAGPAEACPRRPDVAEADRAGLIAVARQRQGRLVVLDRRLQGGATGLFLDHRPRSRLPPRAGRRAPSGRRSGRPRATEHPAGGRWRAAGRRRRSAHPGWALGQVMGRPIGQRDRATGLVARRAVKAMFGIQVGHRYALAGRRRVKLGFRAADVRPSPRQVGGQADRDRWRRRRERRGGDEFDIERARLSANRRVS